MNINDLKKILPTPKIPYENNIDNIDAYMVFESFPKDYFSPLEEITFKVMNDSL